MTIKKKYFLLINILIASFLSFNLFNLLKLPIFINILVLIFYYYFNSLFLKTITKYNKTINFLFLLSWQIIINTTLYYLFGTEAITSLICLLSPLILFLKIKNIKFKFKFKKPSKISLFIVPILIDLYLFYYLFQHQTLTAIQSPWQQIDKIFFVLYFFSLIFIGLNFIYQRQTKYKLFLVFIHLLLSYSISNIIYPLGYGFDGLIHRATENWIKNNKFISPKQPFYIGQYSLIVFWSLLTRIKIYYLDIWLIPVLSSFIFSYFLNYILKLKFKFKSSKRYFLLFIFVFLYFFGFNLTTPNNFTYLLMIISVFWSLKLKSKFDLIFLLTINLASLSIHPLVSAPCLIFSLMQIFKKYYRMNKWLLLIYYLLLSLTLPALFTIYLSINHQPWPNFTNPFSLEKIKLIVNLFKRPYWYGPSPNLIYTILYLWQRLIPITIIFLSLISLFKKKQHKQSIILIISFFAFLTNAWLLRCWIYFPNVADFNQDNYSWRLIRTSIIFLIPLALFNFYNLIQKLKTKKYKFKIFIIIIASLLTISLYFSYPQKNKKVNFPGYNVSQYDFLAVKWIHEQNEKLDYVVLANQLTSVAALTEYSFIKDFQTPLGPVFYYSIPAGGPLYKIYQKMVYQGQKRKFIDEVFKLTTANKVYFIIDNYWKNFDDIVKNCQENADGYKKIANGQVYIFWYNKKNN